MQIQNGATNEILKALVNRVSNSTVRDKFLGGSAANLANLTENFAQTLDILSGAKDENAGKFERNGEAGKFYGGEISELLRDLSAKDEKNAQIYAKLEKEAKVASQMFKKFDFMQMMTKLEFGRLKEGERAEIFAKMNENAREI